MFLQKEEKEKGFLSLFSAAEAKEDRLMLFLSFSFVFLFQEEKRKNSLCDLCFYLKKGEKETGAGRGDMA